jgi:hypothetical protein
VIGHAHAVHATRGRGERDPARQDQRTDQRILKSRGNVNEHEQNEQRQQASAFEHVPESCGKVVLETLFGWI